MHTLDWDDLRYLFEILRCRSLTVAARRLGVNQSTVGRRLDSLERALNVRLVQRGRDGIEPTVAGQAIRINLERIENEMRAIEREVGGRDSRPEGTVHVSAPVVLARRFIAPGAAAFQARYPEIVVRLSCYARWPSHDGVEPDVLLRWNRFTQPDLVARRIATIPFGLYASIGYIAQHGRPEGGSGCEGHTLIVFTGDEGASEQQGWIARWAWLARIVLASDSFETQLAATVRGAGLCLLPRFMADGCSGLVRIDLPVPSPVAEIWVGLRPEHRAVARVRIVVDHIAERLIQPILV